MDKTYHVYILECSDGSHYTGVTSKLALRVYEHNEGLDPQAYTFNRRPVQLVWTEELPTEEQAREAERQIKGWSRAKKEAFIRGDWREVQRLSKSPEDDQASKGASHSEPVEE